MNLFARIRATARNRRSFRPRPAEEAGRLAELRTADLLAERLRNTPLELHASRRIPDHVTGRRREFDFLITSADELVTLELKNWVGRVEERDGRILQHRPAGDVVDHGRLVESLDSRLRTLRSFLRGRDIDPPPIRSLLVFAHPDIALPEEWSTGQHELVVFSEAPSRLPSPSNRREFLGGAIWRLVEETFGEALDAEPPPNPTSAIERTREALAAAGTWDVVELYGGRTVTGDVREIVDPEHRLSDRESVETTEFDVSRSYLRALTRDPEVTARVLPRHSSEEPVRVEHVSLEDTAAVRPAGASSTVEVDVRHLESIRYGYTTRLGEPLTWEELESGERHLGRVRNIVEFGLFVDFGGPTDGLVHIGSVDSGHTSEAELFRRFDEGDIVDVRITGVRREEDEIDLHLVHHNPSL